MKKLKRFAALVLVLALVVGLLPQVSLIAHAEIYSGNCGANGDNLKWKFDSDTGVLTITGSGEMADFTWNTSPWSQHRSDIKTLILPEGMTRIGEYAFCYCGSLNRVTIPDSVTSIGKSAFYQCSAMSSVSFGASVTNIDNRSFYECASLTNLTIGNNVDRIGDYAFYKCAALKSLTIENSALDIGSDAFYECSALSNLNMGNCVKSIGDYAFSRCQSLTQVTIPGSVTNLGESIFFYCKSLKNVTIQKGVKAVGSKDFGWCTGLVSVAIPDSVTSIGESAFEGCESLSNVAIPDGVTNIGKTAFAHCSALERVSFPDGLITIGDYSFNDCRSIESVTIPNSVINIGQGAFVSCIKLEKVTIGNGVTSIGDSAFEACNALTKLELGNSVNSIGDNAFYWCPHMTSVQIPSGVTSIGEYAFGYYNENHYKVDDFTIFGSPGTAAQTYAEENGFRFGGTPCVVTVNPPMAGCHPATTGISADPSHYKVTAVAFHPMSGYYEGDALTPDDTFALGTTYRVWVRLTGTGGYTLTDDTLATINGILAESHGVSMGGDAWYTVDMTAEEMPVCEVTVTPPKAGQHPVSTGESADTGRFTAQLVNYAPVNGDSFGAMLSESEAFTPNQVYRVFVVLWPVGDWSGFTVDTPVTINGISATYFVAISGRGMYYVDMKCENPFVDVHESEFFFNPVMWAVGQTVTGGIDETHFAPERTVMRCDSMVFFWAAKGRPAHADIQSPFVDVQPKHWYYDAVMWAVENKITGGTDATHFSPKRTCSRSEILQFLYAAMGKPGYTIENPYSDVKPKHWYYDGAIWAYENGMEKGEGGKYNAKTPCTRGYVVTYLYRFLTGNELAE